MEELKQIYTEYHSKSLPKWMNVLGWVLTFYIFWRFGGISIFSTLGDFIGINIDPLRTDSTQLVTLTGVLVVINGVHYSGLTKSMVKSILDSYLAFRKG